MSSTSKSLKRSAFSSGGLRLLEKELEADCSRRREHRLRREKLTRLINVAHEQSGCNPVTIDHVRAWFNKYGPKFEERQKLLQTQAYLRRKLRKKADLRQKLNQVTTELAALQQTSEEEDSDDSDDEDAMQVDEAKVDNADEASEESESAAEESGSDAEEVEEEAPDDEEEAVEEEKEAAEEEEAAAAEDEAEEEDTVKVVPFDPDADETNEEHQDENKEGENP